MSPVGQDSLQGPLHYPGRSGHQVKQHSGQLPHRIDQGTPELKQLRGVGTALGLPHLVAGLNYILNDVELVVHYTSGAEVIADVPRVGGAHVDGKTLDNL